MPWNETECAKRGEKIVHLETRVDSHDKDIRELQTRPPVWVTWAFAAGGFVLGSSLTIIVVLVEMVNKTTG